MNKKQLSCAVAFSVAMLSGCMSSHSSGDGRIDAPEVTDEKPESRPNMWNSHIRACATPELRERNKNFCPEHTYE